MENLGKVIISLEGHLLVDKVDKAKASILSCFPVVCNVDTRDWSTCLEQLLHIHR